MKQSRIMMGMPIILEIVDLDADEKIFSDVFEYFDYVDKKFSTYKGDSEISRINSGEIKIENASADMQEIFRLAEQTRIETFGYFDIKHAGKYDPSGIVKGWAIQNAAEIMRISGFRNFYLDVGGDIQVSGKNSEKNPWRVGIRHPLDPAAIAKVLEVTDCGIATSGTYLRGQHIYNPFGGEAIADVISLTVVGPNIYGADRFATAAFAMGKLGIQFIEKLAGFEAYQIEAGGIATKTSRFGQYVAD